MKERNRDQAWRMIVGFDRRQPTSDDIQMPTRRGNVGGRRSEASGFLARPGGVMPRHDIGAELHHQSPMETAQSLRRCFIYRSIIISHDDIMHIV